MGDGGLNKRNCLQLLHSAYNLQFGGGGGMEYEEFTDLFFGMFNKKWDKLTCSILTRQYTVGLGATGVLKR